MNDPLGLFEEDEGSDPLGLFSTSMVDQIPGLQPEVQPKETKRSLLDYAKGVGETALNVASSIPAMIYGVPAGMMEANRRGFKFGTPEFAQEADRLAGVSMHANTYEPRTEVGKEYAGKVGEFINNVGIPAAGIVHTMPPARTAPSIRSQIPKVEEAPRAKSVEADPIGLLKEDTQLELPLENTAQHVAEMRAREVGQRDLFAPRNEGLAEVIPEVSKDVPIDRSIPTVAQRELFDQPEMGRVANPYEAKLGDWRVDENGIPVKVDLSMEAANLENPLQRNIWGDELPPVRNPIGQSADLAEAGRQLEAPDVQGGIPLTQAIDSMDWAHRRGAIKREFGVSDLDAPGNLQFALEEANRRAEEGLSENPSINTGRHGQGGGLDIESIFEGLVKIRDSIKSLSLARERPIKPPSRLDTPDIPRTPGNISTRQDKMKKVQATFRNNPAIAERFKEWDGPATIEEARTMLDNSNVKDIGGSITGINLRERLESGLRSKAAKTGHPLLTFANRAFSDARASAVQFSRDYITGPTGLAKLGQKLKTEELTEVMRALQEGDKHQRALTRAEMEAKGFTEAQKNFVEKFYAADKALLDAENQARRSLGMDEIKARGGHMPGIFNGTYKTLVLDAKDKPMAVIATDTAWGHKTAMDKVKEMYPDAKFQTKHRYMNIKYGDRKRLGGNQVRSDYFSGMNDVMRMLAENDPKFAELQTVINKTINDSSNSLYGFKRHELDKKGVIGNAGNKPWLTAEKNAKEAFQSILQYFEEGAQHYSLLEPMNDVSNLVKDYSQKYPNTTQFLSDYSNHVMGRSTEPIGQALNIAIDTLPQAMGLGSKIPLKIANEIKTRMSQKFMGFMNAAFTISQWVQAPQSGGPFIELVRQRLGTSLGQTTQSAGKGVTGFMGAYLEQLTSKDLKVDQFSREAFQYANDRGMLNFSELEKAQEATKSRVGRAVDTVAEVNMRIGEAGSRGPVFMAFAHILKDAGATKEQAFRIAENLTQVAMIDYHPWERPRVYANLGVMGQFAGGLTTFKHGYLNQQIVLGKEVSKGHVSPILTSGAAMIALAGVSGLPFYGELDKLFQEISSHTEGGRKTIREAMLNPLFGDSEGAEAVKTGVLSTVTGLNWQGKFTADYIPDTLGKAASPHLSAFAKIMDDAVEVIKYNDAQSFRNLANDASPGGWIKGHVEEATSKGPDGELIDRQGQLGYPRTEEDWSARKTWGMSTQKEALNRQFEYEFRKNEGDITKKHIQASSDIKRAVVNGVDVDTILNSRLYDNYMNTGGNPDSLLQLLQEAQKSTLKSAEERNAGTPSKSNKSAERFMRYYEKEHK